MPNANSSRVGTACGKMLIAKPLRIMLKLVVIAHGDLLAHDVCGAPALYNGDIIASGIVVGDQHFVALRQNGKRYAVSGVCRRRAQTFPTPWMALTHP